MDDTAKLRATADKELVFVYGTLRKNHGNNHYLAGQEFLGVVKAPKRGIMIHLGGFPACNFDEPLHEIEGEIYKIDRTCLAALDRLEGVPDFYSRITLNFPAIGPVWTYAFSKGAVDIERHRQIIPSGVWRGRYTPAVNWLGWGKGLEVGMPPDKVERTPDLNAKEFHEMVGGNLIWHGVGVFRRIQVEPPEGAEPNTLWFIAKEIHTQKEYGPFKFNGETVTRDGVTKPKIKLLTAAQAKIAEAVKPLLANPDRSLPVVKPAVREEDDGRTVYPSSIGPGSTAL